MITVFKLQSSSKNHLAKNQKLCYINNCKEVPMSDKQIEYSVFCIENVAKQLGKTGSELFQILNSSGLLHSYIIPSYEALHTQSKQYIVDEIISVLKERNLVV